MDLGKWLTDHGLAHVAATFEANGIGADLLADLTDADLRELGLNLGDRKRLLKAIAARDAAPAEPAPAPVAPASPTAERRQLNVMFVDLVGSTALSATLDPEAMSEVLRAYQNAVAGEIGRLEGHVAKFMGDGVLAYFGWPRAHEDEAERAVRAGLAVAAAIARLATPAGVPLQARVGIATGLVVVGDLIGEGSAQERVVVGDTPNLAARLQALAEPGEVVIADTTRQLLGDLFALRALGPQALKGLPGPVPAHVVTGERTVESRFAARQGQGVAPIVGRDQELALLLDRWRQAGGNEGQLVLLTGEAGIGKSRITEALVEAVAAEPHFLVRYQCSPYHADSALYPAIQQIAHAAGFAPEDGAGQRLDKLDALLRRAADEPGEAAPLIAGLMGLDGTARYGTLALTPQQRRSRTLAAMLDQLGGLAARRPVLWVVEDAHWIDPTTLELIELALDRVQASRVLVLVTTRPTFSPPFASHPVVTRLALNRLARAATQAIVARITQGKTLPEALIDEIAGRTDGVPLFVEEMTKAVLESGALRETAGAFLLDGPLSALAIPTSLHDSLMARLDRLHPVKEVAQTAAVIGRAFDHRTIAAMAAMPEAELGLAMGRLVEAELVFRRGQPPEATYLFKHALVRDAAYESLLKSRRTTLHGRLVEVLEQQGDAAPEVKAQHAEAAGLPDRALDYWEQAGRQAVARPAFAEAIASFHNAIRLSRVLPAGAARDRREHALQLQLGQALIAKEGYQASATLAAFEAARALADALGTPTLQLPALYGLWAGRYIAGIGSSEVAQRYATLAREEPDSGIRLIGLRMLALERFHEARFAESLELARASLALYDPALHADLRHRFGHDPRTAAGCYVAWNQWHLGFPDQALRTVEETYRWTSELNHTTSTCLGLTYGVIVPCMWLRLPARVEHAAREMLRLADEMALALWQAWGRIALGWALSQAEPAAGIESMEAGLARTERIGSGRLRPLHMADLAEALARCGRLDEGQQRLDEAFAALDWGGDVALATEIWRKKAVIASLRGDDETAAADLGRARALARAQASPMLELRAARDLAVLLADKGRQGESRDLLAPLVQAFTEGFATPDLVEARAVLARLA
ncbi:MAG: adenylate/guanylate cyclase domain-containing protein [Geminicoccaceae bacterium]